jgi:hypothetical protein
VKSQWVFCSACDRMVRVLIAEASTQSGQAELQDAEVVCLEIGVACTGNMCPLGGSKPGAAPAPGSTN